MPQPKDFKVPTRNNIGWLPTQDYHCQVINRQLEDLLSRLQKKRAYAILPPKSSSTLQPSELFFTIDWGFKMKYCMNFYLNWHRKYEGSKLEGSYLLHKKRRFNFDPSQFLCQLRQKFIQYLILKLQSMVKKGSEGWCVLAPLGGKITL